VKSVTSFLLRYSVQLNHLVVFPLFFTFHSIACITSSGSRPPMPMPLPVAIPLPLPLPVVPKWCSVNSLRVSSLAPTLPFRRVKGPGNKHIDSLAWMQDLIYQTAWYEWYIYTYICFDLQCSF
jgi:hypothetical protein